MAVGGGHRAQQFLGPLGPGRFRQYGHDLEFGVEGHPGDLLSNQQRVVHPAAGLLPPPPAPAGDRGAQQRTGGQQRRLEVLAVLHPQVAPESGQRPGPQHGHGCAVQLEGFGLVGVGGLPVLGHRPFVGPGLVGLGPVGTQGPQQQAAQDPLPLLQFRQGAHQGDEGVGARVQQVVVPEGAQGHVLGAVGPQGHAPGPLTLVDEDGVLVHRHLPDTGLGVVGGELAPHHLVVLAAGQQGHAVHVGSQFQGEGFGDGDGLEQVLHPQERALAGARRRHRQQRRGAFPLCVAEQQFPDVGIHSRFLSIGNLCG